MKRRWYNIISECRLRIADLECAICLIFQSAILNLKSEINFAPMLQHKLTLKAPTMDYIHLGIRSVPYLDI